MWILAGEGHFKDILKEHFIPDVVRTSEEGKRKKAKPRTSWDFLSIFVEGTNTFSQFSVLKEHYDLSPENE